MSGAADALKRLFIGVILTVSGGPLACLAQSTAIGTVAGQFKVSPTGAATYSIPLQLPPSPGGMAPELAIVYNSQGADTYLGPGFAISGLSQISVCPTTVHVEGYAGGRARCPNGQKLVAVPGTGNEYRTRIDGYRKIAWDGVGYTVKTKAGITDTYGESASTQFIDWAGEWTADRDQHSSYVL